MLLVLVLSGGVDETKGWFYVVSGLGRSGGHRQRHVARVLGVTWELGFLVECNVGSGLVGSSGLLGLLLCGTVGEVTGNFVLLRRCTSGGLVLIGGSLGGSFGGSLDRC